MSSLKALFGSGGGGGVPIGAYVDANSALPDLVVDGTLVYLKTGVVALSSAYPLAPKTAIGFAARWVSHTAMPALANSGAYDKVVRMGSVVLAMSSMDANGSVDMSSSAYARSSDEGVTFTSINLPVGGLFVRDLVSGGGFFFLLARAPSTNEMRIYRSATGLSGSWTQIFTSTTFTTGAGAATLGYNPNTGALGLAFSDYTAAAARVAYSTDARNATPASITWTLTSPTAWNYNTMSMPILKWGKLNNTASPMWLVFGPGQAYATADIAAATSWVGQAGWLIGGTQFGSAASSQALTDGNGSWMLRAGTYVYLSPAANHQNLQSLTTSAISIAYDGTYMYVFYNSTTSYIYDPGTFAQKGVITSLVPMIGAVSLNGVIYSWNRGSGYSLKSLPAADYTDTGTAYFQPLYNGSNQYTGSAAVFMRVA